MASEWGNHIRLSIFGESHGPAIGAVLEGVPAGLALDMDAVAREMARRAPGTNPLSTARAEKDAPRVVSGLYRGRLTGTPLTVLIENADQHSHDYSETMDVPRPGHADYSGHARYMGFEDPRGGGHFSGRLTAPMVFSGEVCRQWLASHGISIGAHIQSVADVSDGSVLSPDADMRDIMSLRGERLPVLHEKRAAEMEKVILDAKAAGDSVGGVVECVVTGLPAGLGAPFFDSAESILSHLLFSVPAVKGVEFGAGFAMTRLTGRLCNDSPRVADGKITFLSNRGGGIAGGVTTGAPIVFRAAIRPTPTVSAEQPTVSLSRMENVTTRGKGRHDPCIVPRAVPVVEAVAALGVAEMWKERLTCAI